MKKIIFILLLSLFFIPGVNAEEIQTFSLNKEQCDTNLSTYETYKSLIDETLAQYKDFDDYYAITINEAGSLNDINIIIWDNNATMYYEATTYSIQFGATNYKYFIQFYNNEINYIRDNSNHENPALRNLSSLLPDNLIDTNYNFYQEFYNTLEIEGFYSNNIILKNGDLFPTLKQLYNYSSWDEYLSSQYIEVNLDNYEYVILNLKDYSKTEAFESKLQVKGMIGITPVYEFGTIEKENVTDRCNISYSDFTDYRFFILENDLINNAIYYVKGCESGSSFKYDSTIFDITYVTADNVNDPVITYGGNTYHVIPFNKLNTTANSNEENNFVPGASEQFEPGKYLSSFWNSLTTLMGLVTKFFNTLPIEIRAISITAFFTAITLGVIKIIKS